MAGIDGVKPLGPIWPKQPLRRPERKEQGQQQPRGDERPPPVEKDDDQTPSIDEYI